MHQNIAAAAQTHERRRDTAGTADQKPVAESDLAVQLPKGKKSHQYGDLPDPHPAVLPPQQKQIALPLG